MSTLSGFELIPNQPIVFDLRTDECRYILDDGYCQKFERDDPIRLQIKRTPCGNNLICTDTTPNYEPNIINNEEFATDLAGWTTTGGVWNWNAASGGVARKTGGGGAGSIYQSLAGAIGGYRISCRTSNATGGTGGIYRGADLLLDCSANGSYDIEIYNTEDPFEIGFYGDIAYDGDLEFFTVEPFYICYQGNGWGYDEETGYYTHVPGYNVALTLASSPLSSGAWYLVTIEIEGCTIGSAQINVGDNVSDAISVDGSHTRVIYSATSNSLSIIPTIDFDGSARITEIYEMSEPSTIELVDASDTTAIIADLRPYATLNGDRINLKFTINQLINDGAIPGNVTDACYRIKIDSDCAPIGGQMVTNHTFTGGSGSVIDDWTNLTDSSMIDYTFGDLQFDRSSGTQTFYPTVRNSSNPLMTAGNYTLLFLISKNTNVLGIGIQISMDGVLWSPTFYTMGLHTYNFDGYVPGMGSPSNNQSVLVRAIFNADGSPNTGQIAVDNVRLFKAASALQPLFSNCISIKSTHDCTKWIEAYSDCQSHGFDFRNFRLGMRVPFLYFAAEYPIKETSYIYSDGSNLRTTSMRDKFWQAKVDRVDEITHDALSVMLLQSTFTVDSETFFFKGNKYQVRPDKLGRFSTYRSEFQLSEASSAVFGYSCGDCSELGTPLTCTEFCELYIDHVDTVTTVGWYYNDDGELQYWDGAEFTTTKTCEGYIQKSDSSEFLIWNAATSEWQQWIAITSLSDDGVNVSLEAIIPTGCVGQVQISTNEGGEWTNATIYYTAQQLLAGITFELPVGTFWIIIKVRCSACEYYSPINETYG